MNARCTPISSARSAAARSASTTTTSPAWRTPSRRYGIRQGTLFCQQNVGIFTEVLALAKGSDLPGYAASKQLPQPIEVVACPAPTRTAQAGANRR